MFKTVFWEDDSGPIRAIFQDPNSEKWVSTGPIQGQFVGPLSAKLDSTRVVPSLSIRLIPTHSRKNWPVRQTQSQENRVRSRRNKGGGWLRSSDPIPASRIPQKRRDRIHLELPTRPKAFRTSIRPSNHRQHHCRSFSEHEVSMINCRAPGRFVTPGATISFPDALEVLRPAG